MALGSRLKYHLKLKKIKNGVEEASYGEMAMSRRVCYVDLHSFKSPFMRVSGDLVIFLSLVGKGKERERGSNKWRFPLYI